jgi:hypothetical protein
MELSNRKHAKVRENKNRKDNAGLYNIMIECTAERKQDQNLLIYFRFIYPRSPNYVGYMPERRKVGWFVSEF